MIAPARAAVWPLVLLLVVASGLGVVVVKHESRKLFVELQGLERIRDELNVNWGRLRLESGYLTAHDRVRSLAQTHLDMDRPAPGRMAIVNLEY